MSMSVPAPYPARLEFHGDLEVTRWRPLVQWLLAVPHLFVAEALNALRQVLTLISLFTVLFTKEIPRPLFDAIAMTYRYEWRAMSYALFLHEDYPPFSFAVGADDDGIEPHTTLSLRTRQGSTGGHRSTSGSWPFPTTSSSSHWRWPRCSPCSSASSRWCSRASSRSDLATSS
jgi:hypothetical protein